MFAFHVTCGWAYVVQVASVLWNAKLPRWDFETICQNIRAVRSAGVQQNKNSGTRVAIQTVDTTANEGSKTMGRGFLNQANPSPHISGRDAGRQETEVLFSRLFPTESAPCDCRHQGRLRGHWSPSGNETSHTQETIWSSLMPPVSISHYVSQVTNLLSVLAEAPLVVTIYIFREHSNRIVPIWNVRIPQHPNSGGGRTTLHWTQEYHPSCAPLIE